MTIGDKIYTNDEVQSIDLNGGIQDVFSIGNTPSVCLDLVLRNTSDIIYNTTPINVEIGLNINNKIEYIPLGIFNINKVKKDDFTIKITAYDNMSKFKVPYFSSLGNTATLTQVANEVAAKTGVQFEGTLPNYSVKKLEGFSCREVLGFIASLCGGNAIIKRNGKFTIVYPTDINRDIGEGVFDFTREEVKYKIGKITCKVEDKTLSKGSLGADSMEIQFENPWMNEAILTGIYKKLNGFEYLGYTLKWQGDPSLDIGDIIIYKDDRGVIRKLPIFNRKLSYDGGLDSELFAKGETKNKNSFDSSGSMKKKVDRVVTELAIVNEALVDVAYIGDLTAGNIKFDTASGTIMDLQTLLAKHVTGENGQFLNLTTNNVTISNALLKDVIAANISVKDLKAGNIDANRFNIVGPNGNLVIKDNTIQIKDSARVRVQIGKDASGDYSMYVWDKQGKLMFDALGLKSDAIKDKIIRDDMVSDTANINGSKLNISSLITEINKDNTQTLKATKIELDKTGQSLEVSFNSLKTNVDNIQIGGRNLVTMNTLKRGNVYTTTDFTNYPKNGSITMSRVTGDSNGGLKYDQLLEYEPNTNYILKFNMKCTADTIKNIYFYNGQKFSNTKVYIDGVYLGTYYEAISTDVFDDGEFHEIVATYTTPKTLVDSSTGSNQTFFQPNKRLTTNPYSILIERLKLEKGNKATDWSPAPEDISDKIQTNTTAIKATQEGINTLVKDTTIEKDGVEMKLKDAYSNLDQTVDKISGRVTSTETKFNNLQIGARNLLSGTKDWKDVYKLGSVLSEDHNYKGFSVLYGDNSRGTNYIDLAYWSVDVKPSAEYTLSFYAKGGGQIASYFYPSNIESGYSSEGVETDRGDGQVIHTLTGDWKRYWITWKTIPNSTGLKTLLPMRLLAGTIGYICGVKLEEGNKATDWSPSPEEIDKSISNLSSRVESAELKLDPEKIVTTVKNHQTNGVNTFALSSEVKQTTDAWVAKFSSSGGYNLVKNGGFKNGLAGWGLAEYHPNGTSRSIDVWNDSNEWILDGTHALCMRSTYNTTGEFRVDSQKFKVKQHTNYTISYLVSAHRLTGMGHYVRGNEWEILAHDTYQPKTGGKSRDNWTRITHTFNTGNNHQISVNFFHSHTQHDAYSWITDVMIHEGDVALPWSPHPTEIHEGSTMIDGSGVTIYNGALTVKNSSGTTMLQGDTSGTFYVKDGGIVVAGTATDVWNNRGYRTTLRKQGVDFNFDSDGGGYPPFHGSIYLDYSLNNPGIVLNGIKTISGGGKGSVDVSGSLGVSSRLGVGGDIVADGDISTARRISLNGSAISPASWGNGGKWGSLCIDGTNNGWAGLNFNAIGNGGMYQLVNHDTFGCHDTSWLWRNERATFKADGRHNGWVGGYEAYRGGGHFRIAPSDNNGGARWEAFNTDTNVVGSFVFDGTYLRPNSSNGYILGYSSARWQDVYCTRGAFNGSDSKLKENIKAVSRTEVEKLSNDNEPTSINLYNYVKDTGVYTFNYKNTTNNMLGVLADEIPDNIFNKIGIMTKTEEEYQNELQEQEKAKKVLESIPMPLIDEEDNKLENTIVEGTKLTYKELKEKAEKTIEEPMRLINAPAQVSMLQEVLSMTLNKIEELEQRIEELEDPLIN